MKEQVSLEKAEKFARELFSRIKSEEEREYRISHARSIGQTALILAKNKNMNKDTLLIAGWLHDIGYIYGKEDHAKNSLKLAEEKFELSENLKDCILNHGSEGSPKTEEGKIINLADKACILDKDILNLLIKYNKDKIKEEDLSFLKSMTEKTLKLLKDYKL